jgi:hypothetical protein
MSPTPPASHTITIEPPPTHCTACGAEYENIQHPMKPPGVIIMRVCQCKPVYSAIDLGNGNSIQVMTMVPPEKPTGPIPAPAVEPTKPSDP